MSAEKKLPKRRFKQFLNTPSWEQRKLGEVASLRGGYAFKSGKFLKKGIPVIRISNILSDGIVGGEFAHYYEEEMEENFIVKDKSILIAMSGATTGKVGILHCEENQKFYQNQRVGYFEPNDQWSYKFIGTFVKSKLFEKQLDSVLVAGAQPNISSRDINDFDIWIPNNINEQNQIGVLFESFDNLITLHQRKLNKLENLKKAYLEELFPDGNQCKPKRRFKEFKDDWEQRKLGDVTSNIGDGLHGTPKYDDSGEYYFINGNNLNGYKVIIDNETKKVPEDQLSNDDRKLNENSILMSINGTIGTLARYNGEKIMLGKSVSYINPSDIDRNYLYYYLQNDNVLKTFYKNLTGTTIKNLGLSVIKETCVMKTTIDEEFKIGRFFENFDNLITLHQRKLQKLKKMKEAYLEELFV